MELGLTMDTEDMAMRGCDGCTACCVFPAIPKGEFTSCGVPALRDKPFNKECGYCDGSGCSIYDSRPEVCRGYVCAYRMGILSDNPKVSKVACAVEPSAERMLGWVLVAQCADSDTVLDDPKLMLEISRIISRSVLGVPFHYAVVRAPNMVSRVRWVSGKLECEQVSINPDTTHIDVRELKSRPLQTFASELCPT
jgi:hypothetical protein